MVCTRYRQDEDEEERQRLRIMHCVMQLSGMLGAHLDLSLPNIIIIIIVIIMIMIIIIITSTQTVDHSHSRFVGIRCRFLEQKSLNAGGQLHSWDSKRPQGSMCIADFLDA